jgi:hypothetical protein
MLILCEWFVCEVILVAMEALTFIRDGTSLWLLFESFYAGIVP